MIRVGEDRVKEGGIEDEEPHDGDFDGTGEGAGSVRAGGDIRHTIVDPRRDC